MTEKNIIASNSMIALFGRTGYVDDARKLFDEMPLAFFSSHCLSFPPLIGRSSSKPSSNEKKQSKKRICRKRSDIRGHGGRTNIGDIALDIGENFEKYLIYAMPMLQTAAELSTHAEANDDEMIEYTNQLRNRILEAYSGNFQGFKNSPKTQLLMPYAPHILQFLDGLYIAKDMDDAVTKTAVGILGDVADTLEKNALRG